MFSKKQDLVLKITNLFLIIILVISLGAGIGSYVFENDNGYFGCTAFKSGILLKESEVDYHEICELKNEEYQVNAKNWRYINFSVAVVDFIILVTINFISFVMAKKE